MKQTRKTLKSILTLLLALAMMLCVMPISAFAVGTVSENYDAVVAHIAANGVMDEEIGWQYIEQYYEADGLSVFAYLAYNGEELMFQFSMVGNESYPIMADNIFTMKKSSSSLSVDFAVLVMISETEYDMVEASKTINRTTVTTSSTYTVSKSGTYITSQMATELFNATFQANCGCWDEYLGENFGFGLKGLGFTSYDGYVCPHTYDNDCDTDCNHCGETRVTSHSYGDWVEGDGVCQQVCSGCGDVQTLEHDWLLKPGSYQATCKENGMCWMTCTVCGAEEEEVLPKTDDHSYGDWQKVDDSIHSHQCSVCEKLEEAAHRWGAGVLTQPPTEDADGVITYTCADCGAEKYLSTADMIPGDIDGNLLVNRDDVVQLLLHVSMPSAFPVAVPVDFTGDGAVARDDVVQLLLHVSMPEAFPLS